MGLGGLAQGSGEAFYFFFLHCTYFESLGGERSLKIPFFPSNIKMFIIVSLTTDEKRKWKGGSKKTDVLGSEQQLDRCGLPGSGVSPGLP